MDLTHQFRLPATLGQAWAVFTRADLLEPCVPGATVSDVRDDRFQGTSKIKVGSLALAYAGTGRYVERSVAHHRVALDLTGSDGRGHGTAKVVVTATLKAAGDETEVDLATTLSLTGKPAQVGRGVVADAVDRLVDQFAACLAGRFADGSFDHVVLGGSPEPAGRVEEIQVVELGDDLGDIDPAAADGEDFAGAAPTIVQPAVAPASSARQALRTPSSDPYANIAPRNLAQPHLDAVTAVAPGLVKRFGPAVGLGTVALAITLRVIARARR
ncbi:MAG: SRPBCC family protein [Propionibacteriaceae bacterium]